MRFNPNPENASSSPEYWWAEAESCRAVVAALVKFGDMPIRQTVCDKCHAMLERTAKAILSEKGMLGDERSHNLRFLLKRAGVFNMLALEQQAFISDIATLHIAATYPDELETMRIWYSDDSYGLIVARSLHIYGILRRSKGMYGQGGEDACD